MLYWSWNRHAWAQRVRVWRASLPSYAAIVTALALGLSIGLTANLAINAPHAETQYVTRILRVPVPVLRREASLAPSAVAPIAPATVPRILNASPAPSSAPTDAIPHSKATARRLKCLTPRMRTVFNDLEAHFGALEVISTCDHDYYVAGTERVSHHVGGNAVDFLPKRQRSEILAYLIAHHAGGLTMTYDDSRHIHIDIGRHGVILAREDRALVRGPAVSGALSRAGGRAGGVRRRWHDDDWDDDDRW